MTRTQIWDLPLRAFHWLLVLSIVTAYISANIGGLWLEQHEWAGVFTLSLIVFRIVWGFVGSDTSRFVQFFPTPNRIKSFLSSTWSGTGHTPLGAMSVFFMLGLVFTQALTGLFSFEEDSDFYGPLNELINSEWSERITGWHHEIFNALLTLITLHLCAITYYRFVKKIDLIRPMITGRSDSIHQSPALKQDYEDRKSKRNTLCGGKPIAVIVSLSMSAIVFWLIEGGELIKWLSPAAAESGEPAW